MEKNSWKDIFCRQIGTGSFWKKLFNDDFDKYQFLEEHWKDSNNDSALGMFHQGKQIK